MVNPPQSTVTRVLSRFFQPTFILSILHVYLLHSIQFVTPNKLTRDSLTNLNRTLEYNTPWIPKMRNTYTNYITTLKVKLHLEVLINFGDISEVQGRKITRRQLNEWLSKQDVYTSHHPILRRFARKRIITRGIDDIWDADLMDMTNLAEFNDGTSFLCIFIDIFSRQLTVIPMKNKSTNETLRAFKKAMKESQSQPETLRTDAGKEFLGSQVRDYLADREIYQQVAKNEHKANYAERVIRTLKKKIYKYLYSNKTQRYIDVLQDLVDGYNNSFHSGIKCSPSSVTKDNQHTVWIQQYMPRKGNIKPPTQFQFQVGDLVRISNIRDSFFTWVWTNI